MKKEKLTATPNTEERDSETVIAKKTSSEKEVILEGVKTLTIITKKKVLKISKKTNEGKEEIEEEQVDEEIKTKKFQLKEVSSEEIAKYRATTNPYFVLKKDGKLYATKITRNTVLLGTNFMGEHQCCYENAICSRLSNAPDQKGGCAKVRANSKGIEEFPWITEGYETFNTRVDSFMVSTCLHCLLKKEEARKPIPKNMEELKRYKEKIRKKKLMERALKAIWG